MSTFTIPWKGTGTRRAPDRVAALEARVADLNRRLASADTLIRAVMVEKSDTYLDLRNAEQARDCAQADAAAKGVQNRELKQRIRDLEEQRGQAPAAPLVTAQRFDTGQVLRAGKRPVPSWARGDSSSETTQSIDLGQLRQEVQS
ncbi:hypothetical protein [Streptomyces sp. NBC_01794]|uniref:hypothetical protein n=1 Tax=Streptomyces sp. NBC_01794 TaxID=2975942 RepID=UPI0030936F2B|nr:hypothetical protein OIE54_12250 [Streptomyces sp. NBC_01794]